MAKLIYSAMTSLDGYVADADGKFDWAAPDEEVHSFVNDLERPVGTYLYGRRMYEVTVDRARAHAAEEPGAGAPAPHELVWRGLRIIWLSSSAACGIGRSRSSRFPTATRGSP
jgi:hypothetical protein